MGESENLNIDINKLRSIIREQLILMKEEMGVSDSVKKIVDYVSKEIFHRLKMRNNFSLSEDEIPQLNDFKIYMIKVEFDPSNNFSAAVQNGFYDNKYMIKLLIPSRKVYPNIDSLKIDLFHELNHSFEEYNRNLKGKTYKEENKDTYNLSASLLQLPYYKDFVNFNKMVYFSDSRENNAVVSELFGLLNQNKNKFKTTNEFQNFINNTDIFVMVNKMSNFSESYYLNGLKVDSRFREMIGRYRDSLKINTPEETIKFLGRRIRTSGEYLKKKIYRLKAHFEENNTTK